MRKQITKLRALVQVNGKGIRLCTISSSKEEEFEKEMIEKYSNGGKDLVYVFFREI